MAWAGYLSAEEVARLADALSAEGRTESDIVRFFLHDIPHTYTGNLAGGGLPPKMRVTSYIKQMNMVANLTTGEVPLKLFLAAARDGLAQPDNIALIDSALRKIERTVPGGPAPAAGAGPDSAPQVRANLPAAADINTAITQEAFIAGTDETLPVAFLKRGVAAARSVFKVIVHRHMGGAAEFSSQNTPLLQVGTAWMIGPGLAITNHHVIEFRIGETAADPADFTLQAETARLLPDFHDPDQDVPGHALGAGCIVAKDRALDFVILRVPQALGDRPPLQVRRNLISKRAEDRLGPRVNLLQHPNGAPLRLGFRSNFVVKGNADILSYLTDTAHGSSGAPVCDDAWNATALHVGSEGLSGPPIELFGKSITSVNFGVPITKILDHLEAASPAVFAEIAAPPPGG